MNIKNVFMVVSECPVYLQGECVALRHMWSSMNYHLLPQSYNIRTSPPEMVLIYLSFSYAKGFYLRVCSKVKLKVKLMNESVL